MKKSLISAILLVVACLSVSAQNRILNNPDNKAYFGLRIGGELTCPGDMTVENVGVSVFNVGGGSDLGAIYNIPIVANFYIEPGLRFYYNTYSVKGEFMEKVQDEIPFDALSIRKYGMRIPVMAGYHFDFTDDIKVSVFTGPELEIGFSAKAHATMYDEPK